MEAAPAGTPPPLSLCSVPSPGSATCGDPTNPGSKGTRELPSVPYNGHGRRAEDEGTPGTGSYSRDSGDGCTQTRRGCKIESGQCVCGVGCYYEYRYNSKSECYKAIKSREPDLCQRNPCKNGGTCSQTSQEPGFKCRCEGTGFYGQRCQYACPKVGVPLQGAFPYECIVI